MQQLVCISSIDWGFLWQRHQAVAAEFDSVGYEVIFIENTGFRNPGLRDLRRIIKRFGVRQSKVGKTESNRITVLSPVVLPPNGCIFRWLNRNVFVPRFMRRLAKLGVQSPDVILYYLPTETTLSLIELLSAKVVVFDCVSNFWGHTNKPSRFESTLKRLIEITDLVFTDSNYLFETMGRYHNKVKKIHHGVDVEKFNRDGHPTMEFKSLCFFGAIDNRVDMESIMELHRVGAKVTLIGEVKDGVHIPEGVEFLSTVAHENLPNLIQNYDCFIIPYKLNEFTKGIVPAKIFECFATGKPVLISNLPYAADFRALAYICTKPEEYVEAFLNLGQTESLFKFSERKRIAQAQSSKANLKTLRLEVERELEEVVVWR